jgi:hypothetical protein
MVLDGSDGTKEVTRRQPQCLMLTTESQEGVGLVTKEPFCYKRAMETQPLLKVTIPNIVDDSY